MTESVHCLEVRRDDLRATRLVSNPQPGLDLGQVLLRIDRFGLTSNNVTYGVVGDRMGYWSFFPAAESWGRVPVWGFAQVVAGGTGEFPDGTSVFGFLPMATHLVVEPGDVSPGGFTDVAAHRAQLAPVYNRYRRVDRDGAATATEEAQHAVFYPLFATSFVIDDFLLDQGDLGADRILLSSASSKTALGTAMALAQREGERPRIVGLTSPRHREFVAGLGCYDEVATYSEMASLDRSVLTVYVDFSGNAEVRRGVHEHLGEALAASYMVGATHWDDPAITADLPGPVPTLFFAPAQISKRIGEWGAAGYQRRLEAALERLLDAVGSSISLVEIDGLDGLERAWQQMLDGSADPATACVVGLGAR